MQTRSASRQQGADEDKAMGVPVIIPISAPRITGASHEVLVKWRSDRKEYEEQVRRRCQATGAALNDHLVSVVSSFDDHVLTALCDLRWKVKKEDLTDERALEEIDKIINSVKNKILPDIDALFAENVRMNMNESDVHERVLQYFLKARKVVSDHGLKVCFEGDKGSREYCRLLIDCLSPATLKQEVTRATRFLSQDAKAKEDVLHDLIVERALAHEEAFQRNKRKRGNEEPKSQPLAKSFRHTDGSKGNSGDKIRKNRPEKNNAKSEERHVRFKDERDSVDSGPVGGCLKCEKNHWLSKCPDASAEEKKRLPKEHAAARKKKNKDQKASMKRIKECLAKDTKYVVLGGLIQLPYCADTGSDRTLLSRKHVNEIKELIPTLEIYELRVPVEGKAIGGAVLECTQAVKLNITIQTAAGRVTITEPTECVILECEEDEFILGQDVLASLGIDVDNQLERLAVQDSADQDDPIPFDEDDRINKADQEELMKAIHILLQRALDNGFPLELIDELKRVVFLYDIWRIALGRDPPARVPPLKIRLRSWKNSDGSGKTNKVDGRARFFL